MVGGHRDIVWESAAFDWEVPQDGSTGPRGFDSVDGWVMSTCAELWPSVCLGTSWPFLDACLMSAATFLQLCLLITA